MLPAIGVKALIAHYFYTFVVQSIFSVIKWQYINATWTSYRPIITAWVFNIRTV